MAYRCSGKLSCDIDMQIKHPYKAGEIQFRDQPYLSNPEPRLEANVDWESSRSQTGLACMCHLKTLNGDHLLRAAPKHADD